jgi:acylphosphatase
VQVRKHVYYSGDVQGVGFRYTARRLAEGRAVSGFVRNLADGRVELAAEGPEEAVAAFLDAVADAMGRTIVEAEILDEPAAGEPRGFRIAL